MSEAYTEKSVALCKASSSISTIIGGISSFIHDYYMSKFPKNYFRKTYISGSLNSTNLKSTLFPSMYKPYLAIQPQFELGNTFMSTIPLWHTANYYIFKNKAMNYRLIFNDTELGIRIYSIPNRIKTNFNTLIKVETQMKAYDLLNYVNQNFEENGYNFINKVRLPAEIPKIFMVNICKKLGLNFNDKNDREKLRFYLNQHSLGAIEETILNSTGNSAFMYNYTTNLLLNYPDLASHEKSMINLVIKDASVRFQIGCELWIPGTFILEIDNKNDIVYDIQDNGLEDDRYKFNLVFDYSELPNKIGNLTFLKRASYLTELNKDVDELDLKHILTDEIINVLNEIKKNGGHIDNYIDFRIYLNNQILLKTDYEIDYSNFILKTKNPVNNRTYHIAIYVDLYILNKISQLMIDNNTNEIRQLIK